MYNWKNKGLVELDLRFDVMNYYGINKVYNNICVQFEEEGENWENAKQERDERKIKERGNFICFFFCTLSR